MPRKNKNKKQLKPRKSRPKAKRTSRKGSAVKKAAKTPVVAAVLSPEKLQDLYAAMLRCRMLRDRVEQSIGAQRSRDARATAVDREAALAGAIAHAVPGDEIVTAQSRFLAEFIRGTPVASILAQPNGLGLSPVGDGVDNNSLSTLERGTTVAAQKKGGSTVVLAFTGREQSERSALYEKLHSAARSKLPIVCLVETSLVEMDAVAPSATHSKAGEDQFPQIAVDGNDVVAVFRVAQEAIRRARTGHGPSLIECVMPEQAPQQAATHSAAKDTSGPLAFMQQYLERRNLWSGEWQRKIIQEFTQELEVAIAAARTAASQQNRVDHAYSAKLDPEPASA